jgi:hypothetical protein
LGFLVGLSLLGEWGKFLRNRRLGEDELVGLLVGLGIHFGTFCHILVQPRTTAKSLQV